jgi:starch-binding outer membrane protein, SusD/RagB family
MKKNKIFFFVAIAATIFSCKKSYLDLEPVTNYTYYTFPKNEEQAEQAVVAMYRQLVPLYNGPMSIFGEMLSDNSSFRFNPGDRGGVETERLDEFIANPREGNITTMYRECFDGVMRSNYVLESLPNIYYRSDSIKRIRVAEAKFFRAFHYFNLVRLFGDVPIVRNVIQNPDEITAAQYPRRPVTEVYNSVIIPDVKAAIDSLPTFAILPATQRGRLTKPAAHMLLGKVYLTLQNFPDALTNFNAITGFSLNPTTITTFGNPGNPTGMPPVPPTPPVVALNGYTTNFNPITKNSVESILEIQTLPQRTEAGGFFFTFMTQWAPWGTGVAFWPQMSNSRGGINQPTNSLNTSYEQFDIRQGVTIQTSGGILCFRKFSYPNASLGANGVNDAQWPIYRFAEVLLSRAECLNEVGFPNALAFTMLNQVRTRAGLPNKTQGNANPALAVNSQADFRLAIEQERRVEFAGEAHRWFDLVRTGRATTVMTAHGAAEKLIKTTITDPAAYQSIKLLVGIPGREVEEFGYSQNPGW